MRLVVLSGADLKSVFEDIEWNVVAVIGVEVTLVCLLRLRGFENNLEITIAGAIDLALTGPPVECLLVMRPRPAPVHLISSRPKEIGE